MPFFFRVLGPDQCQLFTWSHPSGKRVLEWTAVGKGQHVQNKLLAVRAIL